MHIDRATIVYGIMILGCAGGVWSVLSVGDRLMAPEDLAGQWTLEPHRGVSAHAGPGLTIDQSGKFFQIAFENGPKLNLQMEQEILSDTQGVRFYQMSLANEPWRLNVRGGAGTDEAEVRLTGPETAACGVWNARRVTRAFPSDVSAAKGGH